MFKQYSWGPASTSTYQKKLWMCTKLELVSKKFIFQCCCFYFHLEISKWMVLQILWHSTSGASVLTTLPCFLCFSVSLMLPCSFFPPFSPVQKNLAQTLINLPRFSVSTKCGLAATLIPQCSVSVSNPMPWSCVWSPTKSDCWQTNGSICTWTLMISDSISNNLLEFISSFMKLNGWRFSPKKLMCWSFKNNLWNHLWLSQKRIWRARKRRLCSTESCSDLGPNSFFKSITFVNECRTCWFVRPVQELVHSTISCSKNACLSLYPGPHFVAVNNKNEIIVTDFHNHSVKVG